MILMFSAGDAKINLAGRRVYMNILKVAIWGTGYVSIQLTKMLKKDIGNIDICFYGDSDEKKQGIEFYSKRVFSPKVFCQKLEEDSIDIIYLATPGNAAKQITERLKRVHGKVYLIPNYCQADFIQGKLTIQEAFILVDASKPRLGQLEVHMSDMCNLHCKGCGHFCSLVKENVFPDEALFDRDMKQLRELFWGIGRLKLLGGEPLLNRNLPNFVRIARNNFPDADLIISTNATLVTGSLGSLFSAMRDCHCLFEISLYPIMHHKIDGVKKMLEANGVHYTLSDKGQFIKTLSTNPESKKEESFAACLYRHCHYLREGKIATCAEPLLAHLLNERFGTCLPSEDGVYDIYSYQDGWELDGKLNMPFESCRHCVTAVNFDWENSMKEQFEDWFVR
jgi:hypothetical protein